VNWLPPYGSLSPLLHHTSQILAFSSAVHRVFEDHDVQAKAVLVGLQPFLPDLRLDVNAELEIWHEFFGEKRFVRLTPFVTALRDHVAARTRAITRIPAAIECGLFDVSLTTVRDRIVACRTACIDGMLKCANTWVSNTIASVNTHVDLIRGKVRSRCKSVNDAVAIEDFVSVAPKLIEKLEHVLAGVSRLVDALSDEFR
jgi:hypothetical protein